jgi:hypothetical protein
MIASRIPSRVFLIRLGLIVACISGLTMFLGCGKPTQLSQKRLTIATGSKSGVYYPVGEAMARLIKEKFPDVQVEVLVTEGSSQNLTLLQESKANLALVQNDIAHYALYGENMYTNKRIASLTGMATLFPEVVHVLARPEAGIHTMADLAGKKVAVGTEGSGTFFNAQQIFTQYKLWDSVQKVLLPPAEGLTELDKGAVDALVFSTGLKNSRIAELCAQKPLQFLGLDPDKIQNLVNEYPFYFPSEIPAEAYPGLAGGVPGIEMNSLLVVSGSLTDDDVYLLTKALFGSLESFKAAHPALSGMTANSLRRQMSIPLAPGAHTAFAE